ncbi:MAG TPA: exodeoxyribonuclease I [Oceanospirillales bacterium]|nr:exodeoxyribonuclease I [Oceanospirillaceae bacterium]HBS41337.1 exodeoxyribonuclease I [Oceanospirillales bacterium]
MNSIVWYDYETFGASPAWDRPAQFAGIRTDEDLNETGDVLELFCRQADDYLPHPQAVLITGITPQDCQQKGLPETEFIGRINQMFSEPGTCSAGYNSIRFDDEITRYTLYRNFYDPYAREWQGGNSRWDLLDAMRCAFALRPDGIQWPLNEDGRQSFRLEHLTAANGLDHGNAHDALSDVRATIALARLLKQAQPKLYQFLYSHRSKQSLGGLIDVTQHKPLVHISGMYAVERGCMALIAPLCWHPVNRNSFIAWDLAVDPAPLYELSAEEIALRVFTKTDELPAGTERLPLKEVHINKAPVLAPANTLSPEQAERWGISGDQLRAHLQQLRTGGSLATKLGDVFGSRSFTGIADVDGRLYDGFFPSADKNAMDEIHRMSDWDLADYPNPFQDDRGEEMLFRFRARNFPDTLNGDERERWEHYRTQRLLEGVPGTAVMTFARFAPLLEQAAQAVADNPLRLQHIYDLQLYAESIYPALDY